MGVLADKVIGCEQLSYLYVSIIRDIFNPVSTKAESFDWIQG